MMGDLLRGSNTAFLETRVKNLEARIDAMEKEIKYYVETDEPDPAYYTMKVNRVAAISLKDVVRHIVDHLGITVRKETEKTIPCKIIFEKRRDDGSGKSA